jgi:hypothetical protein
VRARALRQRLDTLDGEAIWGVAGRAYQALNGQELTVAVADTHPWPSELKRTGTPGQDWGLRRRCGDAAALPQALGALRLGGHAVSDAVTANHGASLLGAHACLTGCRRVSGPARQRPIEALDVTVTSNYQSNFSAIPSFIERHRHTYQDMPATRLFPYWSAFPKARWLH